MSHLDGRKLGLWSLRLDAGYCLILGAIVAAASAQISTIVSLPAVLLVSAGLIVMLWAGLVLVMAARIRLRLALTLVMIVNLLATVLILLASVTAATAMAAIFIVVIACEVFAFAFSQAYALHALQPAQ